ncbi:MAG: 16S rRNA (guanine(966)-N(2))-methyltransferase RsmD [Pseudomonadota bacterium]
MPVPAHSGAGEVRIIGGAWKRTPLPVPALPGLRPTPARVRETLFNWLGQDLTGWRCLDAFAGTGALGLEAASRGAAVVLLCEQDVRLVAALRKAREKLGASAVEVRRGDGIAALREPVSAPWDLVLLDPPFDAGLFDPALQAVGKVLAADGRVYLEAPEAWTDERLAGFGLRVERHLRAGAVFAHLLARTGPVQAA